jgi:hypothetical protein
MPTADQWKAKLDRVVDPYGALSEKGLRDALRECVHLCDNVTDEHGERTTANLKTLANGLIHAILEECEKGALDGLFLGTAVVKEVASSLNAKMLGNWAPGFEAQGGGARPLIEKLVAYVREHPFTPSN